MFSPADFNRPIPPPTSAWDNRRLGTILFVLAIVALIVLAMIYDQRVFSPFNATYAVTLTWQARTTLTPRTPSRGTRRPSATRTPNFNRDSQAAWEAGRFRSSG